MHNSTTIENPVPSLVELGKTIIDTSALRRKAVFQALRDIGQDNDSAFIAAFFQEVDLLSQRLRPIQYQRNIEPGFSALNDEIRAGVEAIVNDAPINFLQEAIVKVCDTREKIQQLRAVVLNKPMTLSEVERKEIIESAFTEILISVTDTEFYLNNKLFTDTEQEQSNE